MSEEYNLTLSEIAEKYNVCIDTILRWSKKGIIPYTKLPSGTKRYHYKPENHDAVPPTEEAKRVGIVYARVSSFKHNADLQRQITLLQKSYPDHQLCSDMGNSLNYKRKGLRDLVERVLKGDVSEVVITHKDRLSRFSFEFFQWLFRRFETKIVVLSDPSSSPEREMVDDLVSILTLFSTRASGFKKYKNQIKSDPTLSFFKTKASLKTIDQEDDTQSDDEDEYKEETSQLKKVDIPPSKRLNVQ